MSKHSARSLTVEILTRVEKEGAYANVLLRNGLEELTDGRDRYLATALVNGTLKYRLLLDYALRKFLTKPLSSLPYEVRGILRSGAFQLLFLDKIPAAAAVSEAVELSKQLAGRYSALVNGILRRVAAQGWNIAWPDVQRDAARYLSVRFSHPEWLVRRWLKRWGLEETEALCRLNNEPARTWVRVNRLKTERTPLLNQWAAEGVVAEGGERTPDSFVISGYGSLNRLDSFRQGLFSVQDESSQLVAHIVNPQPGQRVLDACGAPGGKSAHMAELMRNQGWIWAYDLHSSKLTLVEELTERLGVTIVETQQGDARELPSVWERTMDRVLVDAPCSGLGVLRRKADLRWQRDEREIERLPV
ncbi:MAG: 16S rRNA (cytosine(967)-C(5))-methyltransferase RsmB, partial [Peptococcaceae bacterium]|nr:16S rRNA (cytosine(967)-C(5))-methyltransferase RsmB [Peptococcaceae bacterium]